MNFGRTYAIVLRQFYLVRSSIARFLPLFAWVTVDMVVWGFLSRYLNTFTRGYNFAPALLGCVLLWDFFVRVMLGVTMAFLEDVWSRNFLNMFATPLSIPEYLAGLVLSATATSSVGLIVMLVFSTTVFGVSFFAYGILLLPFILVLFLFGIALGIFATSLVLRWGPAAEWFVWPIPAVISPFAAVFYPLSTLPVWMRPVSSILPPAYIFESIRTILAGGSAPVDKLALAFGLALLYVVAACAIFTWIYRLAVRTGLIARYSAESI